MATAELSVPLDESDLPERYEMINHIVVEKPFMSSRAAGVLGLLNRELVRHLIVHDTGVTYQDTLFQLRLGAGQTRNRRPDMAYVSYDRWPRGRVQRVNENAWDVVPDLFIEVVSPTDRAEELAVKVEEYFRAGGRMVWVIYPLGGLVYLHRSPAAVSVLRRDDALDGGDVLPGLALALASIFLASAEADSESGRES